MRRRRRDFRLLRHRLRRRETHARRREFRLRRRRAPFGVFRARVAHHRLRFSSTRRVESLFSLLRRADQRILLRLGARRARRRGSDLLLHLVHALGGGGGGVLSRLELFEDVGEFGVGSIGARALAAEVVGDARGLAAGLGGGGELDGARRRALALGGGGGFLGGGELGGGLGGGALGDGARGLSLLGAREKLVILSLDPLTLLHRAGQLGAVRLSLLLRGADGGVVVAHRVGRDRTRWAARGRVCDGGGGRARENFNPKSLPSARPSSNEDLDTSLHSALRCRSSPRPPPSRVSRASSAQGRRLGARHLHARRPSRPALPAGRAPTTIVASLS